MGKLIDADALIENLAINPEECPGCPEPEWLEDLAYLGHIAFLGDHKGKRITYCETCGQAIDWEGWEFDERSD